METNPIITIKCSTADWSNLGYTVCPSEDKGTIEVPIHLGMNRIDAFLEMEVTEITEDVIRFKASYYIYELHKGGKNQVCVTYTVGGYTDHDGCDWDGTDYNYYLTWK